MDAKPAEPIKPIETRYKGYRFRSRLEARWAVFFDHLHIEWQYEPERFPLGDRTYLPDFWLPEHHCWAEVKGVLDQPTMDLLIAATRPEGGLPADPAGRQWAAGDAPGRILLLGQVPDVGGWVHSRLDYRDGKVHLSTVMFNGVYCPNKQAETAQVLLIREPIQQGSLFWPSRDAAFRRCVNGHNDVVLRNDEIVRDAYRAARSARFEYGESGALAAPKAGAFTQVLYPEPVVQVPTQQQRRPVAPRQRRGSTVIRQVPKPPESKLPWFEPLWPSVVSAVTEISPTLGEVLTRATVSDVVKKTVVLRFAEKADRQAAIGGVETIRAAVCSVTGKKPWGVQCKMAWAPTPARLYGELRA